MSLAGRISSVDKPVDKVGPVLCPRLYRLFGFEIGISVLGRPAASPVKREFSFRKSKLDNACLICRYLDICRGGCPKDRQVILGRYDVPSYFCQGYKKLFDHALPRLRALAQKIRTGRRI